MKAPPLSEPVHKVTRDHLQIAAALRVMADRIEQRKGYYAEPVLEAFEQVMDLPACYRENHLQVLTLRPANPKCIAFTLRLLEASHEWLTQMLHEHPAPEFPPPDPYPEDKIPFDDAPYP